MPRTTIFRLPAPVDLAATLYPLQRGLGDPTMRISGQEAVRATRTPEGPATLHVRANGAEVEARAWGPGARWVLDTAPELLGTRDDRESFTTRHVLVDRLHRRHGGLRLCRSFLIVETLVPTILEQKITSHQARAAFRAIVMRYGEPAPGPGGLRLQPEPDRLARLPYWALHPYGITRTRAETIRAACARATSLEALTALDGATAQLRLMSLPGIGEWTASYTVAAALGDPDVVVTGDLHLPHIVSWTLAGERRGSDERMLELLAAFPGHRGRVMRLIARAGMRPPLRSPGRRLHHIAHH